jgi:hypothetical protein
MGSVPSSGLHFFPFPLARRRLHKNSAAESLQKAVIEKTSKSR